MQFVFYDLRDLIEDLLIHRPDPVFPLILRIDPGIDESQHDARRLVVGQPDLQPPPDQTHGLPDQRHLLGIVALHIIGQRQFDVDFLSFALSRAKEMWPHSVSTILGLRAKDRSPFATSTMEAVRSSTS